MNRDGSGAQLLRGRGANFPAWSPDGTKIAFATIAPAGTYFQDGYYTELWIMNADGSGARSLLSGGTANGYPSINYLPTWSPDSTRIAFVSTRGGDSAIWVIRADGSGLERVTSTSSDEISSGYWPSWSPDGTALAFVCARYRVVEGGICIQQVDGSGIRSIDTGMQTEDPVWSPDGQRLAFTGYGVGNLDIYVVNLDGSGLVRLTDDPALDQTPSW